MSVAERWGRWRSDPAASWLSAGQECGGTALLMKHLMHKRDGNRAFADGGRHALDVAAAHVADREDAGMIRFQQIRRPRQRPSGCRKVLGRQVRTRFDESAPIKCDAAVEPGRIRHGARHHEYVSDVMRLDDAPAPGISATFGFVNRYLNPPGSGDLNDDGVTDFRDVLFYIDLYLNG